MTMTRKCRNNREFVAVHKDNVDGSRSVQLSNCLTPVIVIDPVQTNPAPPIPKAKK